MNVKKYKTKNRDLLLKTIGEYIKEKRKEKNKGILLFSYEYDISNSSITMLERGMRDVQITTLWKLANALDMKFSDFAIEIEKRMPSDFKMLED